MRSVTSAAVRELRTAEIRHEILNSNKLKSYFSENPGTVVTVSFCHTIAVQYQCNSSYHTLVAKKILFRSRLEP